VTRPDVSRPNEGGGARRVVPSPVGPLLLQVDDAGRLTGLQIGAALGGEEAPSRGVGRDTGGGVGRRAGRALDTVSGQLEHYFAGRRSRFDLPLALSGTPFQLRVWEALLEVGYGTTVSYGQLAGRLRRPGSARAVGRANATNPVAIVVPCHRVIGADGSLTGYGGGLAAKRFLLELEGGRPSPSHPRVATIQAR